jgi:hypothetical protein
MPRRLRNPKGRRELRPGVWAFLIGDPEWESKVSDEWVAYILKYQKHSALTDLEFPDLWENNRDAVLAYYAEHYPGHRPPLWWDYSAPRQAQCSGYRSLPDLRRHISGSGQPEWEKYNYSRDHELGIPSKWIDVDPDDPPFFESQPSYLKRHGLLGKDEAQRLRRSDFAPVPLETFDVKHEEVQPQ